MQISVTFKNLDPSDNLRDYVTGKLNRFDKLLDNPAEAHVILSVEKIRHQTEIRLSGDRLKIICREESGDMYSSIDLALDKLEKQLKRQKEKTKNYRTSNRSENRPQIFAETAISSSEETYTEMPQIRYETIEYKPMDIDEASMQMELIPDNFLVFTNSRTNQVNVLYRRKDGHLGLIQPLI